MKIAPSERLVSPDDRRDTKEPTDWFSRQITFERLVYCYSIDVSIVDEPYIRGQF
jgi:hypothetical protein